VGPNQKLTLKHITGIRQQEGKKSKLHGIKDFPREWEGETERDCLESVPETKKKKKKGSTGKKTTSNEGGERGG